MLAGITAFFLHALMSWSFFRQETFYTAMEYAQQCRFAKTWMQRARKWHLFSLLLGALGAGIQHMQLRKLQVAVLEAQAEAGNRVGTTSSHAAVLTDTVW